MLMSMQDVGFAILSATLAIVLVMQADMNDVEFFRAITSPPVLAVLVPALALCAAGLLLAFKTGKALSFSAAILAALVAILIPLAMQNLILGSALIMAALVGLSLIGTLYNNAFWTLCAYAGLTAAVLWLLEVTIGSLLGQSLFFLIAGLVLLGMAYFVTKLLKRAKPSEPEAETGEASA